MAYNINPEIIFDFSLYHTYACFTDDLTLQSELDPCIADWVENI